MKKRQFTTFLLVWLFSQQLFAAVWAMPYTNVDCVSDGQNDCFSDIAHIGHVIPTDSDVSSSDMSMMCDHCSATCQPSLIPSQLAILTQATLLVFEAQSITTPADTFLSTLYRPPIPA
jgi:hypothetical protein